MPNPLPSPRNELVIQVHDALLRTLQEYSNSAHQLRADEGLFAVEVLFGTLVNNGLTDAPPDKREDVRKFHMDAVMRISSRVVAWPAKTYTRM